MRVYRVENTDSEGPFTSCYAWIAYGYTKDNGFPNPYSDGIDSIGDYVCGVQSIELLKHWFPQDTLNELMNYGYKLKAFDVSEEHVKIGRKQVVFDRHLAIEVPINIEKIYRS